MNTAKEEGEEFQKRFSKLSSLFGLGVALEINRLEKELGRPFSDTELLELTAERLRKKREPEEYYKDNQLNYRMLADDILKNSKIITMKDNKEMYYYNEGAYHQGVDAFIEEQAKELTANKITIHQKNELMFQLRAMTYGDRETLNQNNKYIILKNVIYDLESYKTLEHTPNIFSTVKLPVEFDMAADCPKIKEFVQQVCPKGYYDVKRLFGYCLMQAYPYQRAFMFEGSGANGKSTLLKLLETFLGKDNCASTSLQELGYNKFAAVRLYGKLANIYADLPDKAVSQTGIFKMLTGGDSLYADKKFVQDGFQFTNTAKLIFSANKLPEVVDDTDAFFRRWVHIGFPNQYEGDTADPDILKKLTTPKELSGCFNWATEGLRELIKDGGYEGLCEELREHYIKRSDSLKAFVLERVEYGGDNYITKEEFYNKYVEYCNDKNILIKPKTTVGRQLPQHIKTEEVVPDIGGRRMKAWNGIKFKEVQNEQ